MGQDISKSYTPPPISFQDCLVNGQIDLGRYRLYSKRTNSDTDYINTGVLKRKSNHEEDRSTKRTKHSRSIKRHPIMLHSDDGTARSVNYKDSVWYCLYVSSPPEGTRLNKFFRRRFRLPYSEFIDLAEELISNELFSRWTRPDCSGSKPTDYRLLLLGSLRYLARSLTFDDLEEYTFVSAEVHRVFFFAFIEYGSTILYKKHVTIPAHNMSYSSTTKLFHQAGLNGCLGSSDGTHVGMQRCPAWATINHKGFKLAIPSRNYNATVTHCHQIMGTTFGNPGTWNDKTLVLFDELIRGVHESKIFYDYEFSLYELDSNNNIVEIVYKGAWFIVDNGYLDWSCTVPPMKHPVTYEEIRFSEWIESMRKDIECTFGIMKCRFAILKNGIRLESISQCDQVWRTCCALHNKLLIHDELDKGWEDGTSIYNEWDSISSVPFSVQRLSRHPSESNSIRRTDYPKNYFEKYTVDGKRVVAKMPLKVFQERLIHNFDIRFKNNDIKWPKRKS